MVRERGGIPKETLMGVRPRLATLPGQNGRSVTNKRT